MSRYKDEQCRICRREGQKLFLKGARCYSDKCSISRRNYAPGQHGQKRAKLSEYGTQLREKQKTVTVHGHSMPAHCNRILPMLRIPNRQNPRPQRYHTEFSVQKIPTHEK